MQNPPLLCFVSYTYSFKGMVNGVIRGLVVVLVGILLVTMNGSALPVLVRLLGVVFFLPALVSLVNLYTTRKGAPLFPLFMMSVINFGSIILGACLMLFPVAFLELFVILLALLLLCFSFFQLYVVLAAYRTVRYGLGMLAVPLLLAFVAVVMLFNPFGTISTASIVLGICIALSGLSDIVITISGHRRAASALQKK